jgi:hypothetical protein
VVGEEELGFVAVGDLMERGSGKEYFAQDKFSATSSNRV